MILRSLATVVALVSVVSSAPNNRLKRQATASSAASAALSLNSAVAYQICIIAQGAFAAAAALGTGAPSAPNCDALLAATKPVITTADVSTSLFATGCYYAPSDAAGQVNGVTCPRSTISANGIVIAQIQGYVPPVVQFTISSSNGACTGIRTPFTLSVAAGNSPSDFTKIQWNVDCKTGLMTVADSSMHLCLSRGILYTTNSPECVIYLKIYATAFTVAGNN